MSLPMSEVDPSYHAIRLRGLASLIRASAESLPEVSNYPEVALFISSTLDEISAALDGGD